MTNRELIQRLLSFPMDAEVKVLKVDGDGDTYKDSVRDVWEDANWRIILE